MKNDDIRYAAFGDLLVQERIYIDPSIDFRTVCAWLSVRPAALDRLLVRELGYSGDGLFAEYRRRYREGLEEKFGINPEAHVATTDKFH